MKCTKMKIWNFAALQSWELFTGMRRPICKIWGSLVLKRMVHIGFKFLQVVQLDYFGVALLKFSKVNFFF